MAVERPPSPAESITILAGSFDPVDPIDCLLIEYQHAASSDCLPSSTMQRELVVQTRSRDKAIAQIGVSKLIRSHRGFVAAVAHPYKSPEIQSRELLATAARALVQAAITHQPAEQDFADHGVIVIDTELATTTPERTSRILKNPQDRPMELLLQYVADLRLPRKYEIAKHKETLKPFTPLQQKVLPLIILPYEQIAERLNTSTKNIENAIRLSRARIDADTPNNTTLALELYNRGLIFGIRKPPAQPLAEILTNEEMEIAGLLGLSVNEIASRMHSTSDLIRSKITHTRLKVQARTKAELALMVRVFDNGERRDIDGRPPSQSLARKLGVASLKDYDIEFLLSHITPSQSRAIVAYYLSGKPVSWQDVGKQFGINDTAAMLSAKRGIQSIRKALENGNKTCASYEENNLLAA